MSDMTLAPEDTVERITMLVPAHPPADASVTPWAKDHSPAKAPIKA
jgi:hypothetical protein